MRTSRKRKLSFAVPLTLKLPCMSNCSCKWLTASPGRGRQTPRRITRRVLLDIKKSRQAATFLCNYYRVSHWFAVMDPATIALESSKLKRQKGSETSTPASSQPQVHAWQGPLRSNTFDSFVEAASNPGGRPWQLQRPGQLSPRTSSSEASEPSDTEAESETESELEDFASAPLFEQQFGIQETTQAGPATNVRGANSAGGISAPAGFIVEELGDFTGSDEDGRANVIRPTAVEDAESDRSKSKSGPSTTKLEPEFLASTKRNLFEISDSDLGNTSNDEESEQFLMKVREMKRKKRMRVSSGSIGKRTISDMEEEDIGSEGDLELVNKPFFSTFKPSTNRPPRSIYRRVNDRRSLQFQDPPPGVLELYEPDSSEDDPSVEALSRELPYYEYSGMINSDEEIGRCSPRAMYPSTDKSDVESILSEGYSVASSQSSVPMAINVSAIDELKILLLTNEGLRPLYGVAISKVGPERFHRNFRRFLLRYGRALRAEATTSLETQAARFIRSAALRVSIEIKESILNNEDTENKDAGNTREKHGAKALSAYLKQIKDVDDSSPDDWSDHDHDLEDSSLQTLSNVGNFLVSSTAFSNLCSSLRVWLNLEGEDEQPSIVGDPGIGATERTEKVTQESLDANTGMEDTTKKRPTTILETPEVITTKDAQHPESPELSGWQLVMLYIVFQCALLLILYALEDFRAFLLGKPTRLAGAAHNDYPGYGLLMAVALLVSAAADIFSVIYTSLSHPSTKGTRATEGNKSVLLSIRPTILYNGFWNRASWLWQKRVPPGQVRVSWICVSRSRDVSHRNFRLITHEFWLIFNRDAAKSYESKSRNHKRTPSPPLPDKLPVQTPARLCLRVQASAVHHLAAQPTALLQVKPTPPKPHLLNLHPRYLPTKNMNSPNHSQNRSSPPEQKSSCSSASTLPGHMEFLRESSQTLT